MASLLFAGGVKAAFLHFVFPLISVSLEPHQSATSGPRFSLRETRQKRVSYLVHVLILTIKKHHLDCVIKCHFHHTTMLHPFVVNVHFLKRKIDWFDHHVHHAQNFGKCKQVVFYRYREVNADPSPVSVLSARAESAGASSKARETHANCVML